MAAILAARVARAKKFKNNNGKKSFDGFYPALKISFKPTEDTPPLKSIWKDGPNGEKFTYIRMPEKGDWTKKWLPLLNKGTNAVELTLSDTGRMNDISIFESATEAECDALVINNPEPFTFPNTRRPNKAKGKPKGKAPKTEKAA